MSTALLKRLIDLCVEYRVFFKRKGRTPEGGKALSRFFKEHGNLLLCGIDVGERLGIALLTPKVAFVGQTIDDDYLAANDFAEALERQRERTIVLIESGFCPSAEAIFRAGAAYASFNNRMYHRLHLIHPNAKTAAFKAGDAYKSQYMHFLLEHLGYTASAPRPITIPHAASAFGLIVKYLTDHKVHLPLELSAKTTERYREKTSQLQLYEQKEVMPIG